MYYPELTDGELTVLINSVQEKYPMVTDFNEESRSQESRGFASVFVGMKYNPPKAEDIAQYQNEDYPEWLEAVKSFFKKVHAKMTVRTKVVNFKLENIGNVPAENLIFEISAEGSVYLCPKNQFKEPVPVDQDFPPVPESPRGSWVRTIYAYNNLVSGKITEILPDVLKNFPNIPKRDRNAFYLKRVGKSISKIHEYECDEFRHKVNPQIFPVVIIAANHKEGKIGAVICKVTAKNLSEPATFTFPVEAQITNKNTFDEVNQMLRSNKFAVNYKKGKWK